MYISIETLILCLYIWNVTPPIIQQKWQLLGFVKMSNGPCAEVFKEWSYRTCKGDIKSHINEHLKVSSKNKENFAVFWEKTVLQLSFSPIIFIGLSIPIDCFLVMGHFHYQPLQIYLISFTFEVQVNICQKESIYLLLPTD